MDLQSTGVRRSSTNVCNLPMISGMQLGKYGQHLQQRFGQIHGVTLLITQSVPTRFMLINLLMSGRGACIRMLHLMEVALRALTKDGTQL